MELCDGKNHLKLLNNYTDKEFVIEKWLTYFLKTTNLLFRIRGYKRRFYWSYLERLCKRYKIDLVHSPQQMISFCNTKTVWTLHDVQELHYPEYFSSIDREYRARSWNDNIEFSKNIIVSYSHVKQDLLKYFNIFDKNIDIFLIDMNKLWINNYIQQYGRHKASESIFLLYPAVTWEHKNHVILIHLMNRFRNLAFLDVKLICTGKKNEYYHQKLLPLIESYGLSNHITFLDVVSDYELFNLYKTASLVVIPTKYEAGSFPLIESILMNTPVICANTTSLPEMMGDLRFVFEPDNIDELEILVKKILFDEKIREENIENSKVQAQKLLNNNALDNLIEIYGKVMTN
ncbi:MAG: glycosyltransferase family 4 protein [Saprospiraceae bacterium]|nr:glycosyltransferase family 4 protein [Candidatus Brachybacter algidus]